MWRATVRRSRDRAYRLARLRGVSATALVDRPREYGSAVLPDSAGRAADFETVDLVGHEVHHRRKIGFSTMSVRCDGVAWEASASFRQPISGEHVQRDPCWLTLIKSETLRLDAPANGAEEEREEEPAVRRIIALPLPQPSHPLELVGPSWVDLADEVRIEVDQHSGLAARIELRAVGVDFYRVHMQWRSD